MRFELEKVRYIPAELHPGVLYASKKYSIAVHLCACGCGSKIRTPLGPSEWSISETRKGPTLQPSVGNWQEVCRSHYWIREGEVRWAERWSLEQIMAGRQEEEHRSAAYYDARSEMRVGAVRILWRWIMSLLTK